MRCFYHSKLRLFGCFVNLVVLGSFIEVGKFITTIAVLFGGLTASEELLHLHGLEMETRNFLKSDQPFDKRSRASELWSFSAL